MESAKMFLFLLLLVILGIGLVSKYTTYIFTGRLLFPHSNFKTSKSLDSLISIRPIENTKHFMVSAFINHSFNRTIQVISIIKRDSLQPLHCIYCNNYYNCQITSATIDIHRDHFGFPYGTADVLCQGELTEQATHVAISTHKNISEIDKMDFLPVKNRIKKESFKFNFTMCISNLFGNYNNVLQFAQSMETYKLLGVQKVVIYNTSCGPDLEQLIQHYKREGILEILSWPINKFLNPSAGWNSKLIKGDLQYYGQLVTLNECVYRHMYESKYVLLNDIDEIIMPYKHTNLPSLMQYLQTEHKNVNIFLIENHIFPKTQFDESGKFSRPEWKNIPGINILEHIYREPARKNVLNPTKMIINPRNVQQTSVHTPLKYSGKVYKVPPDVCRIIHVRVPLQGNLTKNQLFVDTRLWDFEHKLVPYVNKALQSSRLLNITDTVPPPDLSV